MEVRYIKADDDRALISRVYEESWKHAYRGIIPQDYLDSIPTGKWAQNLDRAGWETMVLTEHGEIAGTSSFCKSRFKQFAEQGEIISIYLLPDYIGKGYGKILLESVVMELKAQEYEEAFLWVLEENVSARRFYEKFGFLQTEDALEDCIGGKKLREIRYRYRLR
ncbi:N-acetyltransferase family protein [Ihubacter sp. rT4E-8]|uniref:GNAT family N-acetyltransferase n=1 Tax=Ihubacter sp. rT4E-8 TaxID=3242369 RepID=UPI00137A1CCD